MLDRLTENETSQLFLIAEKSAVGAFKLYKFIKTKQKERDAKFQKELRELTKKANENMFLFRGNIYDLSYFWNKRKLTVADIENIPDAVLKEAVKKNINELAGQGYIFYSQEHKGLVLTKKGEELVNNPNFISNTALDRMNVCDKIKLAVSQKESTVPNTPEINFNDNVVNNTSEIISEGLKKATNAAEKTAGTAAVSTATVGTGTVVKAAYDVANSVIKNIGKEL